MIFFKKASTSKEIQSIYKELDAAARTYNSFALEPIKKNIIKMIASHSNEIIGVIKNEMTPRQWVYARIADIAGDYIESGQYHIYRGVLNPMGPGKALLRMFEAAIDELVQMKAMDSVYANEQKTALHNNIKTIG